MEAGFTEFDVTAAQAKRDFDDQVRSAVSANPTVDLHASDFNGSTWCKTSNDVGKIEGDDIVYRNPEGSEIKRVPAADFVTDHPARKPPAGTPAIIDSGKLVLNSDWSWKFSTGILHSAKKVPVTGRIHVAGDATISVWFETELPDHHIQIQPVKLKKITVFVGANVLRFQFEPFNSDIELPSEIGLGGEPDLEHAFVGFVLPRFRARAPLNRACEVPASTRPAP